MPVYLSSPHRLPLEGIAAPRTPTFKARGPGRPSGNAHSCRAAGELADNGFHAIRGDGEANTVGGDTTRRFYGRERWDADKLSVQIDQCTAAVAWIDRRARLDEASDGDALAVYDFIGLAIERADDARCRRLLEAQRATQRDGKLPDLDLTG